MKYFVLSHKKETGCPSLLEAALYDKFYADIDHVEYGGFPWYTRECEMKRGGVFPTNGVLVCNDDFYDFDIAGVSRFFHIVSDGLLAVCADLNVDIVDCARVQVLSLSGVEISNKAYNAVLFNELDARKDSDPSSIFMEEKSGRPFRIKKLVLPAEWELDLFKYGGMISGSSSLICSERFKDLAKDFKGIDFTPLDTVLWSGIRAI